MSEFEGISIEELEKRINARQQFLEKVAVFIADIVPKIGEVKRRGGSDSCSETDWEAIDFGHFSFKYNTSWSDVYAIYYHTKVESIRLGAMTPVLVFEEGAGREKKYAVKVFNEDGEWQTALLNVIEHKDEILEQRKKAEEERQEKLRQQTAEERKRAELLAAAERLRL